MTLNNKICYKKGLVERLPEEIKQDYEKIINDHYHCNKCKGLDVLCNGYATADEKFITEVLESNLIKTLLKLKTDRMISKFRMKE